MNVDKRNFILEVEEDRKPSSRGDAVWEVASCLESNVIILLFGATLEQTACFVSADLPFFKPRPSTDLCEVESAHSGSKTLRQETPWCSRRNCRLNEQCLEKEFI